MASLNNSILTFQTCTPHQHEGTTNFKPADSFLPPSNFLTRVKSSTRTRSLSSKTSQSFTSIINEFEKEKINKSIDQLEESENTTKIYEPEVVDRWLEIHGQDDWVGMLDPMDPILRNELIRYGEMAQACYDAFDFDPYSKYCGSCKFPRRKFFDGLGMAEYGYDITRYLYATSNINLPNFFKQSRLPKVLQVFSSRTNTNGSKKINRNVSRRGNEHNSYWAQLRQHASNIKCVRHSGNGLKCKGGYSHVGVELALDYKNSPFLKPTSDLVCAHNLEAHLHLLDGCMDDIYDALAQHLVSTAAAASSPYFKHIVGLAGPPGAGKSTVASEVAKRVNKIWPQKSPSFDSQVEPPEVAIVLPMDGFHLYRHQLDAMEDPEEAHARRGAPWTFDPNLLLECLKTLKDQGSVYCPSFDHGVGDPIEDDIFVNLQHKIVIVEGNYLLLGDGAWKEVSSMFDEKWFVDVDLEKAMQRVLKRHISTGKSPDVAKWRIDYNDRPNAELIMKSKNNADLVIKSIDELR